MINMMCHQSVALRVAVKPERNESQRHSRVLGAILVLVIAAWLCATVKGESKETPPVIPFPQQVKYSGELVPFGETIVCADHLPQRLEAELNAIAQFWKVKIATSPQEKNYTALTIKLMAGAETLEAGQEPLRVQGYTLNITKAAHGTAVALVGRDEAGAFYGLQSLRQLVIKKDEKLLIRPVVIR